MTEQKKNQRSKRPVNEVQLVKIAFPKKRVVVDVGDDLGLADYEGVKFVMWADPSVQVIANTILPLSKTDEETKQSDADAYFDALNEIILDSNIEGLSFATIDDTIDSFDHSGLPWGFVAQVAALYCAKVISESESLKKMFGLSDSPENSGENKNQTE